LKNFGGERVAELVSDVCLAMRFAKRNWLARSPSWLKDIAAKTIRRSAVKRAYLIGGVPRTGGIEMAFVRNG